VTVSGGSTPAERDHAPVHDPDDRHVATLADVDGDAGLGRALAARLLLAR
jgi:hypothetical protein